MDPNTPRTSYVTTSIAYVNARPHVGFALELCIADAFARHRRARGRSVTFVTGTDDHSLKNVLAAEAAGVPVSQWVADHADAFRELNTALEISADAFLRTSTNPAHEAAVHALWRACARSGDLYRATYTGSYCVGCERFFEPDELVDGRCPEHDAPVRSVSEENWFFRLSKYRTLLLDAIEQRRLRIEHEGAREESLAFLRGEVRDLCVSRTAARARGWGLRVPDDPSQVIWVWFDALTHYLAATGFRSANDHSARGWIDADERVHVIGKGIARFHAVFWPAFLASAGLPWPTDLLVHGYVTLDGQKISKSGRTLDPVPLVARYGSDAVRGYLLSQFGTARDGDFRIDRFVAAYNADLANGLGNLVNRVLGLAERVDGGSVPELGVETSDDAALRDEALRLPDDVDAAVDRFALDEAIGAVFRLVQGANRYLARTAPWDLLRSGRGERAGTVVRVALEALRVVADELEPFLPRASAAVRDVLGSPARGREWCGLSPAAPLRKREPLFPRIVGDES